MNIQSRPFRPTASAPKSSPPASPCSKASQKRIGDVKFNVETFDWGSAYYRKHGVMMPADGLAKLKKFDAIYFGAVGAPDVPDHITLWGLRLPICQGFDQYANVRPTKILPGITSPLRNVGTGDLDWVIVRENSEGEYAGCGGRVHRGLPEEVGTEVAIFTRVGVQRIMRYAFKLAQSRPRKFLTVVTKSNAQRHGMVMWDEIAEEVVEGISRRHLGQDAGRRHDGADDAEAAEPRHHRRHQSACRHPVRSRRRAGRQPRRGADRQYRSRAPLSLDVRADPWFGLRHHRQGHRQPGRQFLDRVRRCSIISASRTPSARLMRAVEKVTAAGIMTPDVGGTATTKDVTDAVVEAIQSSNV